jgi:hypothetical protein
MPAARKDTLACLQPPVVLTYTLGEAVPSNYYRLIAGRGTDRFMLEDFPVRGENCCYPNGMTEEFPGSLR